MNSLSDLPERLDLGRIKNIAVDSAFQGRGYGRALVDFIADSFKGEYSILQVGTGDSPLTIPFYERCGFVRHHIIKGFLTRNHDHPIEEAGVRLVDMVVPYRLPVVRL